DPTQTNKSGGPGTEYCAAGTGTQLNTVNPALAVTGQPTKSQGDSSPPTVANIVGTWCFRAEYTPGGANGANYLASSDATHGECFPVRDSTSYTSVQDWLPNDTATVTSAGSTALNGSLTFTLYSGNNCGATSGSQLITPAE